MRETLNEMMIVSCEPKEGSDILQISRDQPVSNSLEFDRVHSNVSGFQDKSQVIHLLLFEVAFFRFEEKIVVLKML